MRGAYGRPEPLVPSHDLTSFDCGNSFLNEWLVDRAQANERRGASRTFVCAVDNRVLAYYSLAVTAIKRQQAPTRVRRNMPEPIPAILLARLAVDIRRQGKGLGRLLLRDAMIRSRQAAEIAGIRTLLVHAADEQARNFYVKFGFQQSPTNPLHLMLLLEEIRIALEHNDRP